MHERFARNPANVLPFIALNALEERSIVAIADQLKDEHGMLPAGVSIRRREELRNHRDALSHTNKVEWGRPAMQAFFDANTQWTDIRAAIVWDMWHSINQAFADLGGTPGDHTISVGDVHATMLHTILRYATKPDRLDTVPSESALLAELQGLRDPFLAILATLPDGRAAGRG